MHQQLLCDRDRARARARVRAACDVVFAAGWLLLCLLLFLIVVYVDVAVRCCACCSQCLNAYTDMSTTVGSMQENRLYNRFRNILPCESHNYSYRVIQHHTCESHSSYIESPLMIVCR